MLLRRLKNYYCIYCSKDMRNIELLLPLLFKKICGIFTTVYICSFPFLLAYKRPVRYVRRQRPFETQLREKLECLSSLAFLSFVSSVFFPFPFLSLYLQPLHQGFEAFIYFFFESIYPRMFITSCLSSLNYSPLYYVHVFELFC
jgi:hypothetical protein